MAVLRESPWYREIFQEGLLQGRQEGLQEGLTEERLKERRENLIRLLAWRFTSVPKRLQDRLAERSLPELKELFDVALDVDSLEGFEAQLAALEQGQT